MIKGCIFDLDGTLVNSLDDLCNSCNSLLKKYHFPTHERYKYNQFVGNGIKKLLERAFPDNCGLDIDQLLIEFNDYYYHHLLDYTLPYDGIIELIDQLKSKGIVLAVVTNKPDHLAKLIVKELFKDDISIVYGSSSLYPTKPDPTSCVLALKDMGLTSEECLFVGDSNVDIFTGKNASMKTIGVAWGFRGKQELIDANADYVVDCPMQIKEIVDENRN